ncbi:MAG: NYN domain-containing protein, partial [Hyphomicrobiaceae bacterium]|nr:NYN domain-containing protein [Hyphomicrobiaceae bacterium]
MKREGGDTVLSAVFVDYDNIYMSLRRKSEEAAKQFAKDAPNWLRGIENGSLITATNGVLGTAKRRIVMNRCYGNPVPRRNAHDNSTDMTSFPFIRHHFLRSGFEVVDCPPLTAQLKNSSDIRMVMDLRDYLTHPTYFDEFIILSGDADFTPVLHRLRQHARRTVIYANDHTAVPYTAICDGEVREADLIALLLGGQDTVVEGASPATLAAPHLHQQAPRQAPSAAVIRSEIIGEVVATIRASATAVPLEALADRAVRSLGLEKTTGTGWAGAGSFRELLRQSLPAEIRLTDQPPYSAYDPRRHDLTPTPVVVHAATPPALEPPRQQPMPVQHDETPRQEVLRQESQPIEQLYEPAPRQVAPPLAQPSALAPAAPVARAQDAYRDEIPAVAKRAPGVEPARPSMGSSVATRAPSQPV